MLNTIGFLGCGNMGGAIASPSSRRAWIEITSTHTGMVSSLVALLAEGVDRNTSGVSAVVDWFVALLAEGVDRNLNSLNIAPGSKVALLAEGVDRNLWENVKFDPDDLSPSSRRAWIEIPAH